MERAEQIKEQINQLNFLNQKYSLEIERTEEAITLNKKRVEQLTEELNKLEKENGGN